MQRNFICILNAYTSKRPHKCNPNLRGEWGEGVCNCFLIATVIKIPNVELEIFSSFRNPKLTQRNFGVFLSLKNFILITAFSALLILGCPELKKRRGVSWEWLSLEGIPKAGFLTTGFSKKVCLALDFFALFCSMTAHSIDRELHFRAARSWPFERKDRCRRVVARWFTARVKGFGLGLLRVAMMSLEHWTPHFFSKGGRCFGFSTSSKWAKPSIGGRRPQLWTLSQRGLFDL